MTKVVLIRPPCLSSLTAVSGGLLTPPLALAYLAGSLRNNGHEVSTIDAIGLNPEKKTHVKNNSYLFGISFSEILKLIPEDVDLIGFSGMFSFEWTAIRPLVNMIGKKFSNKYAYLIHSGDIIVRVYKSKTFHHSLSCNRNNSIYMFHFF